MTTRRIAQRTWIGLLLCLAALAIGGCGDGDGTSKADGDAQRPFTFVSAVKTNTLDPQKMSWNHDIRIAGCLWEPLVRYKLPQMTIEPAAAESWNVSDDGLTWTFHLRPEARWSNGDPLTAEDFIYAWRRAMLPDFAGDYAQLFFCIRGAEQFFQKRQQQLVEYANQPDRSMAAAEKLWHTARDEWFAQKVGLSAPDDKTLVIELESPTAYLIELCAFATFMPNHRHSMRQHVSINPDTGMLQLDPGIWTDPDKLIVNGPYVLAEHKFGRYIRLDQNPHWWNRDSMGNRAILQRVNDNPQTSLMRYEAGEVDWLPDIPTAHAIAADLVAGKRADVHTVPWAGTYFYSFNCNPKLADGSKNPLADRRVRRALSMAIDRKTLVNQVTRMRQPTAHSFVPPDMIQGYQPPIDAGTSFDPDGAAKLLAQAGYPGGAGLDGLSILYNTGGGHEAPAEAIASFWSRHLGISVGLEAMEVRSFRERLKTQKYTIARASWIGDYRDPSTFLDKYHTQSGNNDARWSSPEYDALLAEAARTIDPNKRRDTLRRAERTLLREQPIAPIFHYITLHVFDPHRVTGLHPNAWNFRRLEQVQVHR